MVKRRRKAREAALRALYQLEITREALPTMLPVFLAESKLEPDLEAFAESLIEGVCEHQSEIDDKLISSIAEWDFDRVAAVDRNILRIAAYELFFLPNIPPAATINEAIEIGKKYSTVESGKFINGVLGKVVQLSPKANWNPGDEVLAPEEAGLEVLVEEEPVPDEEEVTLEAESDEAKRLARIGGWRLRSEEQE